MYWNNLVILSAVFTIGIITLSEEIDARGYDSKQGLESFNSAWDQKKTPRKDVAKVYDWKLKTPWPRKGSGLRTSIKPGLQGRAFTKAHKESNRRSELKKYEHQNKGSQSRSAGSEMNRMKKSAAFTIPKDLKQKGPVKKSENGKLVQEKDDSKRVVKRLSGGKSFKPHKHYRSESLPEVTKISKSSSFSELSSYLLRKWKEGKIKFPGLKGFKSKHMPNVRSPDGKSFAMPNINGLHLPKLQGPYFPGSRSMPHFSGPNWNIKGPRSPNIGHPNFKMPRTSGPSMKGIRMPSFDMNIPSPSGIKGFQGHSPNVHHPNFVMPRTSGPRFKDMKMPSFKDMKIPEFKKSKMPSFKMNIPSPSGPKGLQGPDMNGFQTPRMHGPNIPQVRGPGMKSFNVPSVRGLSRSNIRSPSVDNFHTPKVNNLQAPSLHGLTPPDSKSLPRIGNIQGPSLGGLRPPSLKNVHVPQMQHNFQAPSFNKLRSPSLKNFDVPQMQHNVQAPSLNGFRPPSLKNLNIPQMKHNVQAPSLNGLRPPSLKNLNIPQMKHNIQAPSLHGLRPPSTENMRVPKIGPVRGPNLEGVRPPDVKSLPRIPSLSQSKVPDPSITIEMLTHMIREGKLPPIYFNCNSNNKILHMIKDTGRSKRDTRMPKFIPLQRKIHGKDVTILLQRPHPIPGNKPVIHHGPRIILICVSNTYLNTKIQKSRG